MPGEDVPEALERLVMEWAVIRRTSPDGKVIHAAAERRPLEGDNKR